LGICIPNISFVALQPNWDLDHFVGEVYRSHTHTHTHTHKHKHTHGKTPIIE